MKNLISRQKSFVLFCLPLIISFDAALWNKNDVGSSKCCPNDQNTTATTEELRRASPPVKKLEARVDFSNFTSNIPQEELLQHREDDQVAACKVLDYYSKNSK